jgi:hypothetical protein
MKKNLRIVSATAAALLAVAPVAATSVSSVFAADTPATTPAPVGKLTANINSNNLSTGDNNHLNLKVSADTITKVVDGDGVSNNNLQVKINLNNMPTGFSVDQVKNVSDVLVYKSADVSVGTNGQAKIASNATPVKNFRTNESYVAVVEMDIGNLASSADYRINDSTDVVTSNPSHTVHLILASNVFTIHNADLQGSPYVRTRGTDAHQVSEGQIVFANTINGILKNINDKYEVATTVITPGSHTALSYWTNLEQDVRDGLKAAGITVRADGSFDKPSSPITLTLGISATNHNKGSFNLTVLPDPSNGDDTYPQMKFNGVGENLKGTREFDVGDAAYNYIPLNGYVDINAIRSAFKTTVSATDSTALIPTVDASKVNTKVVGRYPVTVSATNAAGKTTKVTFYLTVGAKGATYTTVQADTDSVPVYQINGNTVTDTKTTVKNGDQIATFGTITVGDKSYTRINALDSNLYVETKYVDGSIKPAPTVAKKVMHNAYIYDANHKRVGSNTLAAYTTVNVYGNATKLADGSLVYKIGDNQYVMADNIDGTSRTLTHNAYVYKTSKKRADRRVLRKGSTVTTYGAPYKFKNGKSYYRIGGPAKQYVKVANF